MKLFLMNAILILTFDLAYSSATFYQIPQSEASELNKLFENLGGENWNNNDGWSDLSASFSEASIPFGLGLEASDVISSNSISTLYEGNVSEVNLSGNNLRGFVPVLEMELLEKLDVSSNSFSFEHLEANAGLIEKYIYSPQDTTYSLEIIGNTATVLVSGQQLVYDWFVNDELKAGTNSPEYRIVPNEIIKCRVTSLLLPGLELWSEEFGEIIEQKDTLYRFSSLEVGEFKKLYDSLDGANWKNNEGWPLQKEDFQRSQIFDRLIVELTSNLVYEDKYKIVYQAFVSEVLLSSYDLSGVIPDLHLPNLRVLRLDGNHIKGVIPEFIMPNLEILMLFSNQLTGEIPNFVLPKLVWLILSNNKLRYDLPLLNLPNLELLNLSENELIYFIPNFIMPKLIYLNLSYNKLRGRIPYFNMPLLKTLDLSNNRLNERIPDFDMQMLEIMDIAKNELSREIPDFNMPFLTIMDLTENQLSGEIPDFNMGSLGYLLLANNQLSGVIPDFDLERLWFLYLTNNQLSGEIPDFNMPILKWLYLDDNQLDGEIPDFDLPNLKELLVFKNQFTFEALEVNTGKTYDYKYAPQDTTLPITQINNKIAVTVDGSANSYRWFFDDEMIGNTDINFYTTAADGVYRCEVRNSLLPELRLSSHTISVTNTSVESGDENVRFIQTNEWLSVHTSGEYFASEIRILNSIGEIVYSGVFFNNDESIDIASFPAGAYNFVLTSDTKIIYSRKFVVSR